MMSDTVIVALLSLIGTGIGSIAGIRQANKLVIYRLEQLEAKVQAHNNLISRMYAAEAEIKVLEEKIDEKG